MRAARVRLVAAWLGWERAARVRLAGRKKGFHAEDAEVPQRTQRPEFLWSRVRLVGRAFLLWAGRSRVLPKIHYPGGAASLSFGLASF